MLELKYTIRKKIISDICEKINGDIFCHNIEKPWSAGVTVKVKDTIILPDKILWFPFANIFDNIELLTYNNLYFIVCNYRFNSKA